MTQPSINNPKQTDDRPLRSEAHSEYRLWSVEVFPSNHTTPCAIREVRNTNIPRFCPTRPFLQTTECRPPLTALESRLFQPPLSRAMSHRPASRLSKSPLTAVHATTAMPPCRTPLSREDTQLHCMLQRDPHINGGHFKVSKEHQGRVGRWDELRSP